MRHVQVREHLKFLLRIRANWDWYMSHNTGFYANKMTVFTRNGKLTFTKPELEKHIERTRQNMERKSCKNRGQSL